MGYDKQARLPGSFKRWSDSYDRSIPQVAIVLAVTPGFDPTDPRSGEGERPLKILDVGCGTGVFATKGCAAALPEMEVCGVDLVFRDAPQRSARGGDSLTPGHVFTGAWRLVNALPFGSGSFDIVTCANSFHHYPRQDPCPSSR